MQALKIENKAEEDCECGDGESCRGHHVIEPLSAHLTITIRMIQVKRVPLREEETFSKFVHIYYHRGGGRLRLTLF
jgi:hypothetical protein